MVSARRAVEASRPSTAKRSQATGGADRRRAIQGESAQDCSQHPYAPPGLENRAASGAASGYERRVSTRHGTHRPYDDYLDLDIIILVKQPVPSRIRYRSGI